MRTVGIGKRAAVTSALLGMLAVLGALCFLFPDLLVSRDLRPTYQAHLPVFRGLLQAAIVAAIALGAASVVLLRSRTFGLLGIFLGALALVLGGGEAPPVTTGPRPLTVGLDYFVLELLVLGLVFIPMERVWALRAQDIFRPGWQTDLTHFFVSHAGVQLFSFLTLIPVQAAFAWTTSWPLRTAVASQPLVVQFVEIVLAVDLVAYWVHRAFHHVPVLWRFHAIHHSSLRLDWLAGSRIHLVDALVTRAAGFVPVFVLGFAAPALYAYLLFVSFHAVYIHANVSHRWPRLRWLVATPEFHHWHHTSDDEGLDRNFAAMTPVWDVLFGTAHQPPHWPRRYGTVKAQPPEAYLAQLAYPFRRPDAPPRA